MTDCALLAYTTCTGYQSYPPYFNATRDGDEVIVTVRGPETVTEGVRICSRDGGGPGRCTPGGDHCNNYCRHWPLGYVPSAPGTCSHIKCGESISMRMPFDLFTGLMSNMLEQL